MNKLRPVPYIHVGWLKKLLVGDNSCEWASWFKAHTMNYAKMPTNFNLAGWKMNHTALLDQIKLQLIAEGQTVRIENQNAFRLHGHTGAILSGCPDIIAISNGKGIIYDAKTGQPSVSDIAQVMIYMWAMPLAFPSYKEMLFDGIVVYNDHQIEIPHTTIDADFKDRLVSLIRRVAADIAPIKVPSSLECKLCELTSADCPERMNEELKDDLLEPVLAF